MADNKCTKMPNYWFAVMKFCFGIVCFALYLHYVPPVCNADSATLGCLVALQVTTVACAGFTFVIEPAIIASYLFTPEHYERTILNHVFAFAGFLAYITSGSMIVYFSKNSLFTPLFPMKPYLATGSMFIINGLIYAGHFAFTMFQRCK
ncbi:hypothetical protein CHUAL_005552 [Chamberlinius hualienensis]